MSESTEIATGDEGGRALATAAPINDFALMLDRMLQLATNKEVDAQKFETFRLAANEQQDRAERRQYYQDKAAALFEMPAIRKDSKILIPGKNGEADRVQGTFARWSDMQRAIYPVLERHNLRLTHEVGHDGVIVLVTPVLQHRNGFVERGKEMALPLDSSGGKNNTQGAGSAQSYGMRYTTVAFLGIRYEAGDDDGNLIPLPDEPLNDQQERRVREAEAAFAKGPQAYDEWFGTLTPIDRAWMINTGRHAEFGGTSPLGLASARQGEPQRPHEPTKGEPAAKRERKAPTMTPEQWVEGYERQCRECKSLDDLVDLQTREERPLAALKKDHADLHQRTVKAGSDAYARLSGGGEAEAGDDLFPGGGEG